DGAFAPDRALHGGRGAPLRGRGGARGRLPGRQPGLGRVPGQGRARGAAPAARGARRPRRRQAGAPRPARGRGGGREGARGGGAGRLSGAGPARGGPRGAGGRGRAHPRRPGRERPPRRGPAGAPERARGRGDRVAAGRVGGVAGVLPRLARRGEPRAPGGPGRGRRQRRAARDPAVRSRPPEPGRHGGRRGARRRAGRHAVRVPARGREGARAGVRLLLTGGSGRLGRELRGLLEGSRGVTVHAPPRTELDVTHADSVMAAAGSFRPAVVVHAAAYTDVAGAERDRERCWAVNVVGTRNVAAAANAVGARLVHVSTDYVFWGDRGGYAEDDVPGPVRNYYALTKLVAEEAARAAGSRLI